MINLRLILLKLVGLWICYCFVPIRKNYFPLHSFESWLCFTNIGTFPVDSILSLTCICIPTWKNVSTCCLGASSLRTGYVHLPIMSYIAFIMSSISWKVKGTHMRLHVMCEETTLRSFDTSFLFIFRFLIFPSWLKAFWLSQRKSQQLCSKKVAEPDCKNRF